MANPELDVSLQNEEIFPPASPLTPEQQAELESRIEAVSADFEALHAQRQKSFKRPAEGRSRKRAFKHHMLLKSESTLWKPI